MASKGEAFGNCRVIGRIASGPLTDVFHAVQEPLGRHVAVKALRSAMAPSSAFAAPLVREAEILVRLAHENIPSLYDFVRTDTGMWLVLEHVDGVSAADLLAKLERLRVGAAFAIGLEVARALAHAHARGVVHRDVKPPNILLSREGRVKLIDFGVAREERGMSSPDAIDPGSTYGTPAYMAPEQILGEAIDPRTDVFSLGIVLYQLIAGRRPFDAPDSQSTAHRIRHSEPPGLDLPPGERPRGAERIIARCLEKSPSDRWESAEELAAQLETFLRRESSLGTDEIILAELVRAKLATPLPRTRARERGLAPAPPKASWLPLVRPYLLLFGLIVAGGALIQAEVRKTDAEPVSKQGPLELAPVRAGALRVVAHPWAEVLVDGQRIDVTPLARPIPLASGVHYVTLKHPKANDERRIVRIVPGQAVLLEVNMLLWGSPSPGDAGVDRAEPSEVEDAGIFATP